MDQPPMFFKASWHHSSHLVIMACANVGSNLKQNRLIRIRSCESCAFWVGSCCIWEIENVGKVRKCELILSISQHLPVTKLHIVQPSTQAMGGNTCSLGDTSSSKGSRVSQRINGIPTRTSCIAILGVAATVLRLSGFLSKACHENCCEIRDRGANVQINCTYEWIYIYMYLYIYMQYLLQMYTLLGTNIFPTKALLKMIFLFLRWDMLVPCRVHVVLPVYYTLYTLWEGLPKSLDCHLHAKCLAIQIPCKLYTWTILLSQGHPWRVVRIPTTKVDGTGCHAWPCIACMALLATAPPPTSCACARDLEGQIVRIGFDNMS